MAEAVAALLELWTIDQRRRELSKGREATTGAIGKVEAVWKAAEAAAAVAQGETDKLDALSRQYAADVARCDQTIADLSQKKLSAKSNREYMEIHNGIEQARAEKTQREQSVKDLATRKTLLTEKAQAAAAKAGEAKAAFEKARGSATGPVAPSADESELDSQAEALRQRINPEFLSVYERLVKSGHKSPLMRVDPKNRTTPMGAILSHNQMEQIRQGKLVIDRGTNSILYLG